MKMHQNQGKSSLIILTIFLLLLCLLMPASVLAQTQPGKVAEIREPAGVGVEISTEQLKQILANKSEPVVDVRTPKEYAIAHIPGSIHIYEKDMEKLMQLLPDTKAGMVIYCNGPYCHKVKRVAEQLFTKGYTNIKRYQLGLPVWRAYGNTVQTDMAGCKYIFSGDKTAVWVDARPKEEFAKGTVPGVVNVQAGEVKVANEDGRLPYTDKGTRIVVFADDPEMARKVAEEIAHTAFWNSSYFGGTFADLRAAGLW
jgi:rhodanese-related sulfurtransferase